MNRYLPLRHRLAAATIVLLVFAVGLWTGWHKDAISARLSRWHSELTRTIPSPSPSPSPLTLTESSVEAMAQAPALWPSLVDQTPASWPSLVDQLRREGIELRDRGDTTNAIERLQEALDSEPNNTAVLAELAKTCDLMQLYDRANEIWRKLQEMGPSAGAAYELADRRLKLGVPTPAAAPMPTAPDSSSREASTSPHGTAADFAKYAIKPREHEIDQVPPLPTSTAPEVSSPATRASPAEPGPSAGTAVAQPGGRLIVLRAPNFGWNLALNLKIDGRTAANIVQGRRYDHFAPGGRSLLAIVRCSSSPLTRTTWKLLASPAQLPLSLSSTQRPGRRLPVNAGIQTRWRPFFTVTDARDAGAAPRSKFSCVGASDSMVVLLMEVLTAPFTANVTR